ncbi:MAG: winged helix-turn-helix transcriptional regulator [Desulfobulbaceae bacterium]|nr:winged helix-turn-helix transcriptional regulator [Desulfobulbaceae bacterium]
MEFYYMKLANELEQKIRSGRFAVGERLPSLRAMRRQTGRSISTVYHAYEELEQRGVIDVREKSGFFVRPRIEKIMDRPRSGEQEIIPVKVTRNEMAALPARVSLCRKVVCVFGLSWKNRSIPCIFLKKPQNQILPWFRVRFVRPL